MNEALPRFVVLGEALTDLVLVADQNWISVAGGACWNVARCASTLGLASAWAGAVSDDVFGQEIVRRSEQAGLDPRYRQVVPYPPLIAVVHQSRPPQYFFLGNGTADLQFDPVRLPSGWMDACEIAHFGCISLVREPLGSKLVEIAEQLAARGVRISFDPNHRKLMGPDFWMLVERMARIASILKLSDEDLTQIYPGRSPQASLDHLRAVAPQAMILFTRGAEGLCLIEPGGRVLEQPAFPVSVQDTVGAGDSCIGGFIASLAMAPHLDLASHLRFAAATAALVCTRVGAQVPSRAEVEALLSDSAG